ncbi:Hypothetical-Protein / belonging to T4-LIKE GC: 769 [Synechococcus phage S-PM2]|uniref:Hypothetical-Protein belonging to T4-LIKE GC: 769 n=1 Tax=Synechococcus phage S-PM2 TaxID=238854 RepID=Q5GQT0_BPSYP|nr:Hypothetical-Protein / belonging to T4-LIKE GC: 769 [Synechococcus phage S-PM2]CAF34088.1 Hypothetical-Protein / belonging to T4-LIKE GC: 769 [Synechococcus phage S-PM2]
MMTESLHTIVKHYIHHSDADDLCMDIASWLQRNYQYYKTTTYDKSVKTSGNPVRRQTK